jgi:hypothetical protein
MVTRLELVSDPSGAPQDRHLSQPRVVLGRGPEADWSFGDQAVSRRHAAIYHSPDHDEIEDLGSKWGTLVNGTRVQGRRTLRPGDVVQLASVRLRYVEDHLGSAMATQVTDSQPANVAFDVEQQTGGVISNIGGNQYNEYVQQIIVNRQEAFRQIAPMSRIARGLFILGFSLAATGVLGFVGSIMVMVAGAATRSGNSDASTASPPIPEVLGYPVFALAFGAALVGMALVFLGVIIQFTVSTRKKEVERRYPLPPGWGGHQA